MKYLEYRKKIIEALRQYPGMRQREIAGTIQCWTADTDFIKALRDLESEGKIVSKRYRDIGNMEDYYIFSLREGN